MPSFSSRNIDIVRLDHFSREFLLRRRSLQLIILLIAIICARDLPPLEGSHLYSSSDMVRRYQTDQLGNSNSDQLATKGPHFCHSSFSAYMSSPSSPTVPESNRKRPFSYDDASGESTSRRRFGHSYLRLCLHERSLGAVIGKSGYLVDQIKVLLWVVFTVDLL